MQRFFLPFLNTLTLILALVSNFIAAKGLANGTTVQDISIKYENLFTPADYAFSIWGLIYTLLVLFVSFEWFQVFKEKRSTSQTGFWFAMSNLANACWLFFWVSDLLVWSVVMIFVLVFSLCMIVLRLNMEKWDAPLKVIFFVWWPIVIYLGWVIVASVANVAALLTKQGWDGSPLPERYWPILMIILASGIYLLLLFTRNFREAAGVGIWAFLAIAVKQWNSNPEIAYTAIVASIFLALSAGYHGYKNRKYSPFAKLEKGEY